MTDGNVLDEDYRSPHSVRLGYESLFRGSGVAQRFDEEMCETYDAARKLGDRFVLDREKPRNG